MAESIHSYQARALGETLRIASENVFYRDKWRNIETWAGPTSALEQLRFLPVLSKPELRMLLRPSLSGTDKIASIIHTTGSTGPVTYRYRSQDELNRIAQFGQEVLKQVRPKALRPIAYMLYGPYHGQDLPGVGPVAEKVAPYYFSGAVWEDIFIRQGIELLKQQFELSGMEERVTQIHGAVRLLRIFTQCLMDTGASPKDFAIEALVSFAGYMPTEVRRFLQDFWGVAPIETFSFSETLGGATKCPKCRGLLFMPHLLPEVVALESDEPIATGTGRLLITELFPFGTTQPLIRYFNGDIVKIVNDGCSVCGRVTSLLHIGRDNESCFTSSPAGLRLALGSMDLREAVYTPEIRRTTEFPHLKLLKDRNSHLGAPLVSIRSEQLNERTKLSVVFAPNTSLGLSESLLADRVRERLLMVSDDLRSVIEDDLLLLDVTIDHQQEKVLWK